jgi:hypothetical protein
MDDLTDFGKYKEFLNVYFTKEQQLVLDIYMGALLEAKEHMTKGCGLISADPDLVSLDKLSKFQQEMIMALLASAIWR